MDTNLPLSRHRLINQIFKPNREITIDTSNFLVSHTSQFLLLLKVKSLVEQNTLKSQGAKNIKQNSKKRVE